MKKLIPQDIKNIYHLGQAILTNVIYGFPSRKIKVIGVTGTNGKTTTCQMIAKILEEAGREVALASTINFRINGIEEVNATKYTTLSPFATQKFIRKAVEAGCEYVVLETSSHSLDQYRVWGTEYKTAVITNVTREHLDYHKTMEKYRRAKMKLFKKTDTAVVNLDMEKPEDFLQYGNNKKIGYTCRPKFDSESKLDFGMTIIKAEDANLKIDSSEFSVNNVNFKINLPGQFNIENALAAISVGVSENVDLSVSAAALEKIKVVPGRLESVLNDKGLNIIIDYAVTPDSLEKLYKYIQSVKKENARIISVFGSCGERDRGKRPIMGEIVSNYADFVIITNEDPYHEDPLQIIDEVARGVKNKDEGKNFWKVFARRLAIRKALQIAQPGDIIVVTGKGAEETMAIGNKRISWNDKKVILEELSKF